MIDGSRRITLRNRRFLKKILPVSRKFNPELDFSNRSTPSNTVSRKEEVHESVMHPTVDTSTTVDTTSGSDVPVKVNEIPSTFERVDTAQDQPSQPVSSTIPSAPVRHSPVQPLRKSSRMKVERKMFSAKLQGKSHDS